MTHEETEQEQEPGCNPHPCAPHGFDRSSSHILGRHVCGCEWWKPSADCAALELQATIAAQAAEIEALKSEQHYTYIGKDGKPRLARDMEDEIECWQTLVRYYLVGEASKSDLRAALSGREGE